MLPMGVTSENVAAKYNLSRRTQDEFAARSHKKAAAAQAAGKFKVRRASFLSAPQPPWIHPAAASYLDHHGLRAAPAPSCCRVQDEIVPVHTKVVDPKTGAETKGVVAEDDGIRGSTTADSLAALKPVFKRDGSTTAGNSSQARRSLCGGVGVGVEVENRAVCGAWWSDTRAVMRGVCGLVAAQVTDGASAVLLMTRAEALRRKLPILGVFRSFAAVSAWAGRRWPPPLARHLSGASTSQGLHPPPPHHLQVGVDPAIMGVGPAAAIPVALAKAGLTVDDIDVYEINEAFASQVGLPGARMPEQHLEAQAAARGSTAPVPPTHACRRTTRSPSWALTSPR